MSAEVKSIETFEKFHIFTKVDLFKNEQETRKIEENQIQKRKKEKKRKTKMKHQFHILIAFMRFSV